MDITEKEHHLTGSTRVRKGWFGKVVLQVEVAVTFYRCLSIPSPRPGVKATTTRTQLGTRIIWRDATVDDMLQNRVIVPALTDTAVAQ